MEDYIFGVIQQFAQGLALLLALLLAQLLAQIITGNFVALKDTTDIAKFHFTELHTIKIVCKILKTST